MKIAVYFSYGDAMSCEDVKDSRKFWRMVSKHCKRMSQYDFFGFPAHSHQKPERVIRVKKEV